MKNKKKSNNNNKYFYTWSCRHRTSTQNIWQQTQILIAMDFLHTYVQILVISHFWSTLSNIFLCYHETTLLKNCPKSFKPVYYKRYVDDIFVLFEKPEQVSPFVKDINKRHKNIKFSFETEKDNSFSFLDVKICREKDSQQVFSEKIRSVILVALQHLNENLAQCTHFYIEVS